MQRTPHPDELAGREVLLLGLGAFGGGAGCARALARRGARLTITDLRPEEQLSESIQELEGIEYRPAFGGHSPELFERAEVVVVNPAVPQGASWLQVARDQGCQLTTQVNLALRLAAQVPAVAITGTHGKSSTASLLHHLLRSLPGRTVLSGNVGGSLLEAVEGLTPQDRLIVELSSFQLERLDAPQGWPQVALFTCLRPDHLDRHGDMEHYAAAKRRLLEFQNEQGLALFPRDEASLDAFAAAARGRVERWGSGDLNLARWGADEADLPWHEDYRLPSLLLAARAAQEFGLPESELGAAMRGFRGLPHWLEELPAPAGFRFIDNGIATHPEPTQAAIESLLPQTAALSVLVGGYDKGLPLLDLPASLARCQQVHLFGAGGERIAAALPSSSTSVRIHANCADAVHAALAELPAAGGTLLFSPSFASFDEFRNFRDRARLFQDFCARFAGSGKKSPGDAAAGTY